jgi:hypothetical protein
MIKMASRRRLVKCKAASGKLIKKRLAVRHVERKGTKREEPEKGFRKDSDGSSQG